jgi:hypothetical protein
MRVVSASAIAFLFLVAACGRGGSSNGAAEAGSAAPAAGSAPSAASASALASHPAGDDPSCALVTKAEAEAIFGEPLQDLTVAFNGMCEYRREADRGKKMAMPLAGLELYPGQTKARFEAETKNAAGIMKTKLQPLAGFGEEAYEIGTFQIMSMAHGKAISATHLLPLDRAKFEAFARKAIARL